MTDAPSIAGKHVLVTGGIGRVTAAGLAALGVRDLAQQRRLIRAAGPRATRN
jgi:hypothetical protein